MNRTVPLAAVAALALAACTDSGILGAPLAARSITTDKSGHAVPGSKIAFTSDRDHPNVSTEVYVMNADGSGQHQLTETAGNSNNPEWSPNGQYISFHSNRGGGVGESDIYIMNADGSGVFRLTNLYGLGLGGAHMANWSPDGRKVTFNSFFQGGQSPREIYVIDIDGTGLVNLTNHPSDDLRPDWSPDGSMIAFMSNRSGNPEIYLMHADGSDGTEPTRLTFSPGPDAAPAWSPNGHHIAFQSNRDGNTEIYVMNADGSDPVRLTFFAGADAKPAWSPDGRRIAFHRTLPNGSTSNSQVFTMNADGSDVTMITQPTPGAFNGFPSWEAGPATRP
jgi:Tol biopolymer transport system component